MTNSISTPGFGLGGRPPSCHKDETTVCKQILPNPAAEVFLTNNATIVSRICSKKGG